MKIRVINAGLVSPLYSQAIYHGIAEQMQADDNPVLVIAQPTSPYICIGMHQHLCGEINLEYCKQNNIPVIRRQVGGGSVLLDSDQLFFQFIFPRSKAPKQAKELYPYLLKPVLQTYHHFGIPAKLKTLNDIQVNNKKIGGTGAATINNATVLVGSFMYDFDYHLMSQCIHAPSDNFRSSFENLLEENITSIKNQLKKPPSEDELISCFTENISKQLQSEIVYDKLTSKEAKAVSIAQQELCDDEWLHGEDRKLLDNGVKISSGVYLLETVKNYSGHEIQIRIKYQNKVISTIWLECDNPKIQAYLILVATEINRLQPKPNEKHLVNIVLNATTTLSAGDAVVLVRHIINLAEVREY